MRDLFLDGLSITQTFEPNAEGQPQHFGELLFFPEITSFGHQPDKIRELQAGIAQSILENAEPDELQRRELPADPSAIEVDEIVFELDPPQVGSRPRTPAWTKPLRLKFPFLRYQRAGKAAVAFVPGLGIEVVAPDPKKLEELLEDHVRFALVRSKAIGSLFHLALRQRSPEIAVAAFRWNAYPLSPVERAEHEELGDEDQGKALPEVATQLDLKAAPDIYERKAEIDRLAKLLTGRRATSVLIVGESGVGKTVIVRNLAAGSKLKNRSVYQTSGSRIVAGMTGLGDWQERCQKIAREAKAAKGMVFFGNLFELMQVGQSSGSTESIGSFFRPHLVRGEFIAIAECTPAQLALIEQNDPRILDAFRQLRIEPPPEEAVRKILGKVANPREAPKRFQEKAIDRILSLHRRYAGYSAFPGRAIRFIGRLREDLAPDAGNPVTPDQVDRAFAAETGMPEFLIDESKPLDLDAVDAWFRERLIGQDEAVDRVVDTVAAIKARLTRPGKPLASFLFIGPTGVGKTEMTKTLAEFFFGSKDRLIRLDMSEYSTPGSAGRLAAGGRDDEEGLLTARMRDQPFSVLLLDEFEKADASVYDLFLQVLGEARLTDGAGRLADFSNAIVILTSNLGAREFRATRPGFHDPATDPGDVAADHFTESVKKAFRPEFFNRIDRIVPFLPLTREAVTAVVKRELQLAERRDGLRNRNLTLVIGEGGISGLAEAGYDARYGARPVKRAIEQRLLQPVADYLAERPDLQNGFLEIGAITSDEPPAIEFRTAGETTRETQQTRKEFGEIPPRRRLYQRLTASSLVSELQSERFRIRARIETGQGKKDGDLHRRLILIDELFERIQHERAAVAEAEEQFLIADIGDAPVSELERAIREAPSAADFEKTAVDFFGAISKLPERVLFCVQSEKRSRLMEAVRAITFAAEHFDCRLTVGYWPRHPDETEKEPGSGTAPEKPARFRPIVPETKVERDRLIENPPDDLAALAVEIRGPHAALRFGAEGGLHVFIDGDGNKDRVLIRGFGEEETIEQGYLDETTLLDRNWKNYPVRRQWDARSGKLRDVYLSAADMDEAVPWELGGDSLVQLIGRTVLGKALEHF